MVLEVHYSVSSSTFGRRGNVQITPDVVLPISSGLMGVLINIALVYFVSLCALKSMAVTRVLVLLLRLKPFVSVLIHVPVPVALRASVDVVLVLAAIAFVAPRVSALVELAAGVALRLRAVISLTVIRVTLLKLIAVFIVTICTLPVLLRVTTAADGRVARPRHACHILTLTFLHDWRSISVVVLTLASTLVSVIKPTSVLGEPSPHLLEVGVLLVAPSSVHTFVLLVVASTHAALNFTSSRLRVGAVLVTLRLAGRVTVVIGRDVNV